MPYLCIVVRINRHWGVVYRSKQILLDVANIGFVFFEAVYNEANMVRLQLHKSALDDFSWLIIAGNAYQFSSGTYRFDDQIQNGFEQIVVIRIPGQQNIKFKLFPEIIVILFPISAPFGSFSTKTGRKDRISITIISINSISIISSWFPRLQNRDFPDS